MEDETDTKDPVEMLARCVRQAEVHPDSFEAQTALAIALLQVKRLDEALPVMDRALAIREDVALVRLRGRVHQVSDHALAARRDYARALALDPTYAEVWEHRAELHHAAGDEAARAADLTAALTLEPGHAGRLRARSEARTALGDLAGAVADLVAADRSSPFDPVAWTVLATACTVALEFRLVHACADRLVAGRGTAHAYLMRAQMGDLLGRSAEALADCVAALALTPEDEDALELYAELTGEATTFGEDARRRAMTPEDVAAMVEVQRELQDVPEGERAAVLAAFDGYGGHVLRGVEHKRALALDPALDELGRAIALRPESSYARLERAEVLLKKAKSSDDETARALGIAAAADLAIVCAAFPELARAAALSSIALARSGRPSEAVAAADRAIALDPTEPELWRFRARLKRDELGDEAGAAADEAHADTLGGDEDADDEDADDEAS